MEYVYAAMLLHKAGKEINEENLTQVLKAAGINADAARVKALVASLTEVNIEEAIKSTPTMMAAPAAAPAAPAPRQKLSRKKRRKRRKKKRKPKKKQRLRA